MVHCSIVRLAKRREGLGVERLADLTTLPHAGSRGLRAWRNRTHSRQKSRSDRVEERKRESALPSNIETTEKEEHRQVWQRSQGR